MKISLDWLKDFVDTDDSNSEIAHTLTMLGLEAEDTLETNGLEDIIVAEVTHRIKHPNADRLNLCKVFDGKSTFPIVCGAPNVDAGQKIAFAPVGATLPGDFKINKAKIRGEVSEGMICSEKELNISDEHEGIMVLSENAISGQSFIEYLSNNNELIELDITPNRADCFSHYGVARDYAAKKNIKLNPLKYEACKFEKNEASKKISISIENPNECSRYIAGVVENIKVQDSPKWLKDRLESIGQRSINNIVDISNYVMMEMGQPTHIFDFNKIGSDKILVRKSLAGEEITTLDEIKREMSGNELLITNGKKPIAVAGVMGGLNSAVTKDTTAVVIESAYFDPPTIRKGAKALNMSTDASKRFERGTDIKATESAFWMIVEMLKKYAEAKWVPGIVDEYPKTFKDVKIKVNKSKIASVSGVDIDNGFIEKSLTNIGCSIELDNDAWICNPPSWRPDISREIDIIEEVIRLYGYDEIKPNFSYQSVMNSDIVDPHSNINKLISKLNGLGFNQVFNNTLLSKDESTIEQKRTISVLNPLSDKMSHLRSSLIPGLVKNVDFNYKNSKKDIMLFEYGNTFSKNGSGLKNFNEKLLLSGVIFGNISEKTIHQEIPLKSDFLAIKGLISSFIASLDLGNLSTVSTPKQNNVFDNFHQLKIDKTTIGSFGKISSKIMDKLDVDNLSVYGFELELDRVLKLINELERTFKPINYLPKVERDINFVVDEPIQVGDIVDLISKHQFANLIKIEPLNIFRDKSLGDNKKSITLNFHFQHTSKTLEDKDVNLVINEIIKVVSKNYGAKLR